jgi:hypothetical protein
MKIDGLAESSLKISTLPRCGLFVMLLLCAKQLVSSQPPYPDEPFDIQTLGLVKSGSNILLSCSDGTGPFQMGFNGSALFNDTPTLNYSENATCSFSDTGTLSATDTKFYLVAPFGRSPIINSTNPLYAKPGDTITLKGFNLDGATLTSPEGKNLPAVTNTRTTVTFVVPATGMASGRVQLSNSHDNNAGTTKSDFIIVFDFIPTVNNDLYHVALYQDAANSVRKLLVSGREGAANPRIYILDPDSLSLTPFTSPVRAPMGLSLGTLTDNKPYLFFGSGQPVAAATVEDVLKLDFLAGPPASSLFRRLSTDMTLDPVNIRATSFVAKNATTENTVFAFNPLGTRDVREAKEITAGAPSWAISVWGSNTTTTNYPGGLGVRSRTAASNPLSFAVTSGQGVSLVISRVQFWNTTGTGSTPPHALLWTSDPWPPSATVHPIVNAAQIALEATPDQHAIVVDRGNVGTNNQAISQIHKINTNNCNATSCTVFVSSFKYASRLNDARGVAIESGKNALGDSYSKWLWLTHTLPAGFPVTGQGVSKVRALREIPIQIIMITNVGWSASNTVLGDGAWVMSSNVKGGPFPIGIPQLKDFVNNSITESNKILYDVGYQINYDSTLNYEQVDDSGIASTNHSYRTLNESNQCPAELLSLIALATIDPKRIPVFVVHSIGATNQPIGSYALANGIYGNYRSIPGGCGGLKEAILINYISSYGDGSRCKVGDFSHCNGLASFHVVAHEIYHRLTSLMPTLFAQFGYNPSNHRNSPCDHLLMCAAGDTPENTGFLTDGTGDPSRDDDFANSDGSAAGANLNDGTSLILPDHGAP